MICFWVFIYDVTLLAVVGMSSVNVPPTFYDREVMADLNDVSAQSDGFDFLSVLDLTQWGLSVLMGSSRDAPLL